MAAILLNVAQNGTLFHTTSEFGRLMWWKNSLLCITKVNFSSLDNEVLCFIWKSDLCNRDNIYSVSSLTMYIVTYCSVYLKKVECLLFLSSDMDDISIMSKWTKFRITSLAKSLDISKITLIFSSTFIHKYTSIFSSTITLLLNFQ